MNPLLAGQLLAASEGTVVAAVDAVVLLAQGPDAAPFLHGQLANDVSGLPVGGVNVSLHLNHKGHAVADGAVVRRGKSDILYVVENPGQVAAAAGSGQQPLAPADWVFDSLNGHIIFDDVQLSRPDLLAVTLQGAGAAGLLAALGAVAPEPGKVAELQFGGTAVLAYPRGRSKYGGFDLLVASADSQALLDALIDAGAVRVDQTALNALRVLGAIPTAAGEGGEGVLPQEAQLEFALSYRKGCYLGQEIMARIEARGNLRRSLRQLELSGVPSADSGRQLIYDDRTVGLLGTVAAVPANPGAGGSPSVRALAVVRSDLPVGAKLVVGGVEATLIA